MGRQCLASDEIVARQKQETVNQKSAGVTIRMGTAMCPCGRERAIVESYRCLYCGVWFCESCAEVHLV